MDKPIRFQRSLRLAEYDYGLPGAYFITTCTFDRLPILGDVREGLVILSDLGVAVGEVWNWLGGQYPTVSTIDYVVMPNHFHGIILIQEANIRGSRAASTKSSERVPSLIRLVNAFKTVTAKRINQIRRTSGLPVWQRGFYDHVVRNEQDLLRIREYIQTNPQKWSLDKENPSNWS